MRMNLKSKQNGFTLVEFIVVIAVMGVMIGGGLLSYSLVTGKNAKNCGAQLESYLAKAKVESMSRQAATLKVFAADDGIYVNLSTESRDVKIGNRGLTVTYEAVEDGGGAPQTHTLIEDGSNSLNLSFDRSSGAFKPLESNIYCEKIVIADASRTVTVILIPETGKYYIE